ncbi:hypothetical protein [uncultured Rikenella sp.]|nr:hypothetical protein [uncultured Rikenella sp.]
MPDIIGLLAPTKVTVFLSFDMHGLTSDNAASRAFSFPLRCLSE